MIQVSRDYTQKDVEELTKLTTHNGNSTTALIGKFEKNSVKSYEQIAYKNDLTYFDAGNNGWKAMASVDESLAPAVNKQFLLDQIDQGKDFVLSSNPYTAQTVFDTTQQGKSFLVEIDTLDSMGYKFEKYGDFWKSVKK